MINKKFHLNLFLGCIILFLASCSEETHQKVILTPTIAMDSLQQMSPSEGARFYVENRNEYEFMDELYLDSIMPLLDNCDYYELKEVYESLKDLSIGESVKDLLESSKKEFVKQISTELSANTVDEQDVFLNDILPAIEMGIDSLLEKDVAEIMDDYAGGLMNYKKLAFLFGRDRNDFKKMFWEKFDTLKYQNYIKDNIQAYFHVVKDMQNSYCNDVISESFDYNMEVKTPPFVIGLSQSTLKHVQKYTAGQKDEIIEEAFKDYVAPLAIGAASGGLSVLYDIGTTAYDVKVTIDEIKSNKIDKDDMVIYICEHDIAYQIKNYYMHKWTEQVFTQIELSNKDLYSKILKEL